MSRMSRKITSLSTTALLAMATVLAAGCASATSTKEVPLDQTASSASAHSGKNLNSRSVDMTASADSKSNIKLADNDPLASIARAPTGTIVGNRVNELLAEVTKLRDQTTTRGAQVDDMRGIGASGAVQYYSVVGAIQARLQQGTTPGNPILLRQWDEAQADLDQMSGAVSKLNTTSTDISADASLASYLMDSIKAALQLSGAVDEDHDHLRLLQDVTGRQVVALDRMKTEISGDLVRLNSYITVERANMQTLAFAIEKGEFIGNNLNSRPLVVTDNNPLTVPQTMTPSMMPAPIAQPYTPVQYGAQTSMASMPGASPAMVGAMPSDGVTSTVGPADMDPYARNGTGMGTALQPEAQLQPMAQSLGQTMGQTMGQPVSQAQASYDPLTQNLTALPDESSNQTLAIIRFTDPNVDYGKPLYTAVSAALDQAPNALFTVVAVTPQAGNAAQIATGTADAQRHADDVKRSLIQMGLPPSRIAMSANGDPDARADEVRVLVR